ncbi:MAG: hypothetical protein DRN71_04520 [Candidatus Nanohalarchaeota archaeon]|nr:MAG: hypothetical protein DRN71_04520 [Candidatus Nanohaloarchaeota archaeon]
MEIDAARSRQIREYYLRPEIIERMFSLCEGREVVPVFYGGRFSKRPASVQFPGDLEYMVKKGATSFHCSLEHWSNPLLLSNSMKKNDMDKIRTGWDIFFDIDADEDLEHGRIAAGLIIEALKDHGVNNVSLKFSGRRGFHVAVSCKSLPGSVNFLPVEVQYPELMQKVADYLRDYICKDLVDALSCYDKSLAGKMNGDPYKVVEVEHNWSYRHLFRMPYSFNEKSWHVSLPIDVGKLDKFRMDDALPENVRGDKWFLDSFEKNEASELVMEALEHEVDENKKESKRDDRLDKMKSIMRSGGTFIQDVKEKVKKNGGIMKQTFSKVVTGQYDIEDQIGDKKVKTGVKRGAANKIPEELFPPCVHNILAGLKDGRKRGIFIMVNFLRSVGWEWEDIDERLKEWNCNNPEPLPDSYLQGQLNYAKKREEIILPPNCDNEGYYKDILICTPDNLCSRVRNPVNYALIKGKNIKKKKS